MPTLARRVSVGTREATTASGSTGDAPFVPSLPLPPRPYSNTGTGVPWMTFFLFSALLALMGMVHTSGFGFGVSAEEIPRSTGGSGDGVSNKAPPPPLSKEDPPEQHHPAQVSASRAPHHVVPAGVSPTSQGTHEPTPMAKPSL